MAAAFYLPEKYLPAAGLREAWVSGRMRQMEQGGKIATAQTWIYQTWANLKAMGFEAPLVFEMPKRGIVITLSGFFPDAFRPPADLFFAAVVADGLPHPAAHLHIVQNAAHAARLAGSVYLPHWPHPNLVPRRESRGGKFETLAFFGDPVNLAPELKGDEWKERLERELGISFEIRNAERWHDYSDVDCVLAIRDFSGPAQVHKPATKLYNAWLAGVPFIGGAESAYASDGRGGIDHLVARTPEAAFEHLSRLKADAAFRKKLVTAGTESGTRFSLAATTSRWQQLVARDLPARAEKWFRKPPVSRGLSGWLQRARVFVDRRLR